MGRSLKVPDFKHRDWVALVKDPDGFEVKIEVSAGRAVPFSWVKEKFEPLGVYSIEPLRGPRG